MIKGVKENPTGFYSLLFLEKTEANVGQADTLIFFPISVCKKKHLSFSALSTSNQYLLFTYSAHFRKVGRAHTS